MDTTTAKPLRADARRNREKIVAAARAAFAEYGADAQMDDVAKRAGVGVGTLYRNFPTKDALVRAIVVAQMEDNAALARELIARDGDPWETFETFVRTAGIKDQALAEVIASQPTATFTDALAVTGLDESITTIMDRARQAGALSADASVDDMPIFMCGMGAVLRHFGEDHGRRYLDVMLRGLRAS